MKCAHCNSPIETDAVFCVNCGSRIATEAIIRVGRGKDNDIIVPKNFSAVGREHAQFHIRGNSIFVEDLGSQNGTFINHQPVTAYHPVPVKSSDTVHLSKQYVFDLRSLDRNLNSGKEMQSAQLDSLTSINANTSYLQIRKSKTIRIGRGKENDLIVNDIKVSRLHCRLIRENEQWFIEDLQSSNGTYINGKKVEKTPVRPDDMLTIGGVPFSIKTILGGEGVDPNDEIRGDIHISCEDVTYKTSTGKVLIDDVSLTIYPGEFVGLIGPSGAGKTTLMMLMNGFNTPSEGSVLINSQSLHHHLDLFKGSIGYVPQDDIIHRELTVSESFAFTAQLRLHNIASKTDVFEKIDSVVKDLELDKRKETLISKLSGGQRKRVNLGQELLTDPRIIFLDEPTSGLDPLTDNKVMKLLRGISDSGKIVVLTTHNITEENFRLLTHVVILTEGGKLAYFGPARDAVEYFGVEKPWDIFGLLSSKDEETESNLYSNRLKPDEWKEKFKKTKFYTMFVEKRRQKAAQNPTNIGASKPKRAFNLQQFFTLTQRYLKIKLRDTTATLILLLQAPIIAALIWMIFSTSIGNALTPEETTLKQLHKYLPPEASAMFILIIAAIWLGASNAARELVVEQAIFRRERMVNLKIPSYLFSKVVILSLLCIIQSIILTGIVVPALSLGNLDVFHKLLLIVATTSITSMVMGLFVSSLVRSPESAMGIIPILLIPQVIFGGLIVLYKSMSESKLTEIISSFIISRWAYEGILIQKFGRSEDPTYSVIGFSVDNINNDFILLYVFFAVLLIATAAVLKIKYK